MKKKKRKEKKGKRNSVQELLGIRHFTNYGLMTDNGELVFFRVAPTNISVLSSVNIQQKILGLTNLLKTDPDMGIVCTDSCECFDSNREYLRRRAVEESNPKVKALLEMDRDMLTRMQAEMANAREFYLVKRYTGLKSEMVFTQSNTTMKNISDYGFETERLGKEQIKRLLGIYFGTTVDGDKLPDVDGGQYEQEAKDGTV